MAKFSTPIKTKQKKDVSVIFLNVVAVACGMVVLASGFLSLSFGFYSLDTNSNTNGAYGYGAYGYGKNICCACLYLEDSSNNQEDVSVFKKECQTWLNNQTDCSEKNGPVPLSGDDLCKKNINQCVGDYDERRIVINGHSTPSELQCYLEYTMCAESCDTTLIIPGCLTVLNPQDARNKIDQIANKYPNSFTKLTLYAHQWLSYGKDKWDKRWTVYERVGVNKCCISQLPSCSEYEGDCDRSVQYKFAQECVSPGPNGCVTEYRQCCFNDSCHGTFVKVAESQSACPSFCKESSDHIAVSDGKTCQYLEHLCSNPSTVKKYFCQNNRAISAEERCPSGQFCWGDLRVYPNYPGFCRSGACSTAYDCVNLYARGTSMDCWQCANHLCQLRSNGFKCGSGRSAGLCENAYCVKNLY